MRLTACLVLSLCVAGLCHSVSAFAQAPQSSFSASSSSVSASSSSSSVKPPAAAAQSASASPSGKPELTDDEKRLIAEGYKLQVRKGEKLFCKAEAEIGSRFPRTNCATSAQILARARDDQEKARRIQAGSAVN